MRLSIPSKRNSHIPDDLSLQATSLHQSASNNDFSLPNFEPKSNRSRVLRQPTSYSSTTTSQFTPTYSVSLQATSILHSKSADDSIPNLGNKMPHKTTRPHRFTTFHGRKTNPLITFENFCLQATSVLSDKNDVSLPELKQDTTGSKGQPLGGRLRRTPCVDRRRNTQIVDAHDLNLQAASILQCEQNEIQGRQKLDRK